MEPFIVLFLEPCIPAVFLRPIRLVVKNRSAGQWWTVSADILVSISIDFIITSYRRLSLTALASIQMISRYFLCFVSNAWYFYASGIFWGRACAKRTINWQFKGAKSTPSLVCRHGGRCVIQHWRLKGSLLYGIWRTGDWLKRAKYQRTINSRGQIFRIQKNQRTENFDAYR